MLNEIYMLDLLGTFAFATYGSYFAIKKKFDIFGVFVCAFLTALGGGTIRELFLGNVPFYFYDNNYVFTIISAIVFSIVAYNLFYKINKGMLVVDSVGLVTFAFIGASKANELGLGFFAIVFCATITAIGGGMLRDIAMNTMPEILYHDFYASVAILFGVVYAACGGYMEDMRYVYLLLFSCFVLRLAAIKYKLNLWRPWR